MEDIYKVGEKWLKSAVDTTSTIASTTTAIVATSSARAFSIIGSTSGRPEVPARAAAAAAVARKIVALPPHERLSLPSTSDGSTSVYGRRPRGEPAEELEENFYEEKFDPVRFMLEHLPEDSSQTTQQYFDKKVGGRLAQLDVVTEKLSKQVMENHEEMVQGMQLVTELDRDLQLTSIICKNGRRFLSMAAQEVSQDLLVAANVRKKQVLLDLLPILERIQLAMETRSHLDSAVDEGDYAKALQLCSECLLLLEDCSGLRAVVEVNNSIEEWLHRTVEKVDKVLLGLCSQFEAEKYAKVLLAYVVLDDIPGLAEKVQTYYAQVVVSETHTIIRNSVFEGQNPQAIQQKSRVPYNDLCSQLTEPKFKECLHKSLEVLFDLMCSYYQMLSWLPEMAVEDNLKNTEIESTPLANGKHRRSGSHGDLVTSGQANRHSRTGSLSSSELARFSSHSSQVSSPRFSNLKHSSKLEVATSNGATVSEEDFRGAIDDSEQGRMIRVRDAILSVARVLEKGRKTVWELSARRVAVLLSCDALCASSPHHFLQSLDWVNKFILAGEAFCGAEAMSLRAKLVKQSEKYYWSFHRQNLEVLRIILEKELWQQLSPAALKTLNFHAGIVNGAPLVKASQHGREDTSGSSRQGQVENALLRTRENVSKRASFEDWLEKGNPFGERKSQKSLPSRAREDRAIGMLQNGSTSSEVESASQNGDSRKGSGEDEEDENEDLLADFIDEDSQLPGRRVSEQRRRSLKNDQLLDNEGTLIITSSAVSLLRYTDKYVKLMQILEPIVSEVFRGLCQLFELYFFTIFKAFGQRDHLTFSLRATLVRISQGLEEQRVKLPASPNLASPSVSTNTVGSLQTTGEPSPSSMVQGGPVIPMSPSNLHALKERSVAAESLLCLSEILKKSYLQFKSILPEETQSYMDTFFTQTMELVPELREHIYRVSARLLLNIGSYIDRIANVKWELKELGMEHNGYIDLLLGEYKVYSNKLAQGGVPKEVREAMLECGVDVLAETILEGISRVKRCNNEGRALMSLDLQVLINGLRHLASPKVKENLLIVETYIKAFYLPETEYFHWVRAHPEYSKAQVLGLINLVASTYNWKRKTRVDLLEKIETGEL